MNQKFQSMGCGSSAHQVEVDEAEERNDVDPYKKATKSGEETFNVNLFFSMTPRRYIYIYICLYFVVTLGDEVYF